MAFSEDRTGRSERIAAGHAVVVGAGIAGLAAAFHLVRGGVRVTVLEGAPQVGGKLQVSEIAGLPVDEGAEAMLARRPEGLALVRELGHADRLVYPGTTSAAIWSRGALRPLPAGHIMGVPADLTALARSQVLSPAGLARVPLDLVRSATPRGNDVSVADYVAARLGREVVDRLVEPLLGGVYAGRAEELSFEATMPALAIAARAHRSLIAAARTLRRAGAGNTGPVFSTLTGGLGSLPALVVDEIIRTGGVVRTEAMARELRRTPDGWRVTVGPARAPEQVAADAVIVAVPARPAARLLSEEVPAAAAELGQIEYASMAIVTLAYSAAAFPEPFSGSGYLVPAVEAHDVKAVTFSTTKWPHLRLTSDHPVVVRCSVGRHREEHSLQRSDEDLRAVAMMELARTGAVREPPIATRVTRWGGALPQFAVGHLDRVARIRSAVAAHPGLAVCGAAYDGLGVPACVATGRAAASRVLDHLGSRRESRDPNDESTAGHRGRGRTPARRLE